MTELEKKLKTSLQRLEINERSPVIVAVSGGPDSTSLLDALIRSRERDGLPKSIVVAHLNHLLRGEESDEDEKFVRHLAAQFGLTCIADRIHVSPPSTPKGRNIEATARHLRYDFLRRAAESCGAEIVLTGHTLDDQVETILMRLLRGSGSDGLRGIHRIRPLGERVKLMRPMLDITHHEVLDHCNQYRLAFRLDSSNLSTDLTRNRIRRELLPFLRSFNPRCDQTLIRTAELLMADEDYLQQVSAAWFAQSRRGAELDIQTLLQAHSVIRRRVLRIWLCNVRGGLQRIDASHINAIENLMRNQSGQSVELPGAWRVRREFDRLLTFPLNEKVKQFKSISLTNETECNFGGFTFHLRRNVSRESVEKMSREGRFYSVVLPEGEFLDGLRIRTRLEGDAYLPKGRRHRVKLKTLMIRHRIPLSQREVYPVLVTEEDQIVWVPGLPVAQPFSIDENSHEITKFALIISEKSADLERD